MVLRLRDRLRLSKKKSHLFESNVDHTAITVQLTLKSMKTVSA
jgi:hypothetical protein